jgi:predicted dehydrogenase
MDYTRQPLAFKARKALRYIRLYGPDRTLVKVRSQYHMNKRYDRLPPCDARLVDRRHVGILGSGKFAYAQVAYYLRRNHGDVIRAVMDPHPERAASLFQRSRAVYHTTDAQAVIADPAIDLLYIASNHASHADYAVAGLEQGKTVHIEKPHVVSEDQLERLVAAMEQTGGRVALGFNRPESDFGRAIKAHLAAESGPAMFNWFVAGHEIDAGHWYHREEEGGRILGNLCHWTDFVLQMVPPAGRFPILITPTRFEEADTNIAVTFTFGDGSIAAITFSAKGHTFEGVRERFSAQRGDALISLDDFQRLTIEVGARKRRHRSRFRDHGHERRISDSYRLARGEVPGCTPAYVWETGMLFLRTRQALGEMRPLTLGAYGDTAAAGVVS